MISNSEHRFFLALLLNLENRDQVLELVSARYPGDDPLEKCLDWISELASTKVLESGFENGLGIKGFGDIDILVLEEIILGLSNQEIVAKHNSAGDSELNVKISESIKRVEEGVVLATLLNG